jgi:hypothetical protein
MIRSCYVYSIGALLLFLGLPTKAFLLRQSVSVVRGRSQISRRTCLATAHSPPDDLTKEELVSQFVDVQEYYRQMQEMSQDDLCLSMLRTRLPDLHLNRCFVAPSTVVQAGMGMFASRDITETELITLYPGDALIQWNGKSWVVNTHTGCIGTLFFVQQNMLKHSKLTILTSKSKTPYVNTFAGVFSRCHGQAK